MENKKQNKKSFEQTAAFEKKLNWDSLCKTNEKKGRRWNFLKLEMKGEFYNRYEWNSEVYFENLYLKNL